MDGPVCVDAQYSVFNVNYSDQAVILYLSAGSFGSLSFEVYFDFKMYLLFWKYSSSVYSVAEKVC